MKAARMAHGTGRSPSASDSLLDALGSGAKVGRKRSWSAADNELEQRCRSAAARGSLRDMRALALLLIAVGLAPHSVLAQETSDGTAPAEAAPPPAEAAPAPEAPAAPAPEPVQAPPVQAPPVQAAPAYPPAYAPPSYAPPAYAPSAPVYSTPVAPPPHAFTPQNSPLLSPPSYAPPAYAPPAAPPAYAQPAAPPTYQLPPPSWAPRYPLQSDNHPYVLPPLPPGYVYMPTPTQGAQQTTPSLSAVSKDQLYGELTRIDGRISVLQHQHIGVGGPITMMVLGYGTTLVAGLTGLAAFGAAESIQHGDYDWDDENDLDINDDGRINGHDANKFRRMARISGAIAGGGLLLGIISTRRLVDRREQRRHRVQELKGLTQRRAVVRTQLGMTPEVGPGMYGMSLQGRY